MHNTGNHRYLFMLLAAPLAAGCHARSPYSAPAPPASSTYTLHDATTTTAAPQAQHTPHAQQLINAARLDADWWKSFHSPALNRMVEEALAHSPTLDQARARLRQAEESYRATRGAKLSPVATLNAGEKEQQNDLHTMGLPNTIKNPDAFALTSVSLDVSYSFDFNGGTQHTLAASHAQLDLQRNELAAAQLAIEGNVVLTAIDEAQTRAQMHSIEHICALKEERIAILNTQLEAGAITRSELEQQQQSVAQSRAQIDALALHLEQTRAQLAVYLGHEPADQNQEALTLDALELPTEIALTLPSSLAAQRPDILAADALVRERGAEVGMAQANLYPRFTLSSSLATERRSFGDLIDGLNVWSLGAGIAQPLWNGGQLKAQKHKADAAYQEVLAAYKQTVLDGLFQAAKALSALEHDARQLDHLAQASAHARTQESLTESRYKLGGASRLDSIQAELNTLSTEQEEITASAARLSDSAALMTALGGGTISASSHEPPRK